MNSRRVLAVILIAYLLLGCFYSLVTPPLEASDEFDHYPVVQHLQYHWELPVMDPQDPDPWRQEGGQPPLYYALMAAATSWIDTSDVLEVRWLNRHAFIGIPGQVGNKNLVIHLPEREAFPWQGTVLAVHIIRLLSVGLGAVTVWLVWRVAELLSPGMNWAPPLAASLTAFNPMFLFVSAAVNNDVLAALLGSLLLLLLLRMVVTTPRPPSSPWTRFIEHGALGLVLGLGVLAKVSMIGMVPLAFLAIGVRLWRERKSTSLARHLSLVAAHWAVTGLVVVAVAGWWYLRNYRLYDDPLALNVFVEIMGRRAEPLTWSGLWEEFGTFRRTFWGLFGGVNVPAPEPVNVFYDLLTALALVGVALRAWRQRRAGIGVWWLPLAWVGILLASLLRWTLIYYSFQGRLVFPGIAATSVLMALGLGEWIPERWRPTTSVGVSGVLLALALFVPFVAILPAYAHPQPLEQVPDEVAVDVMTFGPGLAELVGVELSAQTVAPGENVQVTLYWRARDEMEADYLTAVHLLGRGFESVGHVTRHPAMGMVPTSLWQPGQIWRDVYSVPVGEGAQAPARLHIAAALYDPVTGRDLEVSLPDGTVIDPLLLGAVKLVPQAWPVAEPENVLEVALADGVALAGYDLTPASVSAGDVITLTLYWEAWGDPTVDYTAFVHLLDAAGVPVVFGDAQPLGGAYPTGMWSSGESIIDPHRLVAPSELEPGNYRLLVGMYDLVSMMRLARLDGAGDSIEIPEGIQVR